MIKGKSNKIYYYQQTLIIQNIFIKWIFENLLFFHHCLNTISWKYILRAMIVIQGSIRVKVKMEQHLQMTIMIILDIKAHICMNNECCNNNSIITLDNKECCVILGIVVYYRIRHWSQYVYNDNFLPSLFMRELVSSDRNSPHRPWSPEQSCIEVDPSVRYFFSR